MCVLYMFVCKQHVIVVLLCVCIWLAHESASRRAFRQPQHSVFETLNCPVLYIASWCDHLPRGCSVIVAMTMSQENRAAFQAILDQDQTHIKVKTIFCQSMQMFMDLKIA